MERQMKRTITILMILAAVFFAAQAVSAEGQHEDGQRIITVTGTGKVSAAPDVVRLNLGVQSVNSDLNSAIEDNNTRIADIISVIEEYGIPSADFRTSNFSVYYQQPYGDSNTAGTYNVNNSIFVEMKDIDRIGNFIEDALGAGANQFYGLDYAISDPEPLMKKARELAVKNAIELADETAGYADLAIGKIISMEEMQNYAGGPVYVAEMSMARGSNSIAAPTEKTIQVQITIKIELK